jgi:Flp pilus assembly protein TadG
VNRDDERGTVTVFVVGFMFALLVVAGLVFDGGNVLAARRQAANVAESAARAGAQALDIAAARGSGTTRLDSATAIADADSYLRTAGYQGSASVDGDSVLVDVTITQRTFLLGLAGLTTVTVHGRGEAHPVRGIDQAGD